MEQKTAFITGSSRGIGAACARVLSAQGYAIALHYASERGEEQAKALQEVLTPQTPCQIFRGDLSVASHAESLIKEVKARMGRLDVLVNNAGIVSDQLITFAKREDFTSLFQVNVEAVFLLCKAASRIMIKQKQGCMINITSVVGHMGNGGQSLYSASKAAVTAMTKSMAVDLASFGIRCNCIAPGFIDTDMTAGLPPEVKTQLLQQIPLKRMGRPEEIAGVVAFLASDQASYMTGTTLHVNGGLYR